VKKIKRVIRQGVFETNSSSCHSLVIKKKEEYTTKEEAQDEVYLNDEGKIYLPERSLTFGRTPFDCLYSFFSKVKYSIAALCPYKNDLYDKIVEVVKEYIPGFIDFEFDTDLGQFPEVYYSEEYMIERFGKGNYERIGNNWETLVYKLGYVGSYYLEEFLTKYNISIKEFLTNKKYIVIIDGDEYLIYNKLKESGLIDKRVIAWENQYL